MRTLRGIVGLVAFIGMILGLIFIPQEFVFPLGVIYVLYGVVRVAVLGLVERGDDEDDDDERPAPATVSPIRTARHSHGRRSSRSTAHDKFYE